MKIKNKVLVSLVLISNIAYAEVSTILPYSAILDYSEKSSKNSGSINGVYFSTGNLSYLTEVSYSHTNIKYKQSTTSLKQDE